MKLKLRSALLLASLLLAIIQGPAYAAEHLSQGIPITKTDRVSTEATEGENIEPQAEQQTEQESAKTTELDPYALAVYKWLTKTSSEIQNNIEDAVDIENTKRMGDEIFGRIGVVYQLIDRVTADTPWLIRVNKPTCTVTIYRKLEVEKGVLMGAITDGGQEASSSDDSSADAANEANTEENQEAQPFHEWILSKMDPDLTGDIITSSETAQQSELQAQAGEIVQVQLPVYACPCSVGAGEGNATPEGTFTIQDHLRWHELVGPTWGQWCCHFAARYLFHSLPYDRPNDPYSLQADVYNYIGQAASHGCVRLTAMDAKYIYDHVPVGGQVEIFWGTPEDDPLGTPERPFVGEWGQSYDPTDPELPENQ